MFWYETQRDRLSIEEDAMNKKFPGFELEMQDDGTLYWHGTLPGHIDKNKRDEIVIEYPANYPYEAPQSFIVYPDIDLSPHRYKNGSICLFDNEETRWRYDSYTAVIIVAWTAAWIACQEIWENDGGRDTWIRTNGADMGFDFWPGRQKRH